MRTTILNYGMGNLRSVQKALQTLGDDAVISDDPAAVRGADRVVLPGVGAFADGMAHLRERGLDDAVLGFAQTGRPLLGVCLGMQLMMDSSTEHADAEDPTRGLGLFAGSCVRFDEAQADGTRLKVPHMGWNTFEPVNEPPLFAGFDAPDADRHVYFVHGYYCVPSDPRDVGATCEYGTTFCAAVARGPHMATQFHPEKSQRVGLAILRNFLAV